MLIGVIVNAINSHKKKVSRQNSSNSVNYSNPNVYTSPQNGRQSTLFRYNSYADKKDFADLNSGAGVQVANIVAGDESPGGMSYGESLRYQREMAARQNNYNQNNNNYYQNNNYYNQNNNNHNAGGEVIRQEALRQNNVQTNTRANSDFLAAIRGVRQGNQQY